MIILRRRLIFWLIKAYAKRWGRTILIYFSIGLLAFLALRLFWGNLSDKLHLGKVETIGMAGAYTVDDLPSSILTKISQGLTSVSKDGEIKPGTARKWRIQNNDKSYIFYLRPDAYFSDGTNLTSDLISYNFSDVSVLRPDKYTIVFTLKEKYAPFLVTVSRPIFKKGFVGVSDYKIKGIKLNGNFVESIDLVSLKDKNRLSYQFYPTMDALKIAFALGEVTKMVELSDINFQNTNFYSFKNAQVLRSVDYGKLVTLFYNLRDKDLSAKSLREALSYTIPDNFSEGLRNESPFAPSSMVATSGLNTYQQDFEHAKLLLEKFQSGTLSGSLALTISTLPQYENTASTISAIWKKLGISTKIQVVDKVPSNFQIFLGSFKVSLDPDQYMLWHSSQISNITHYNNLRIDKLLEDGRQEIDLEKRKKIYADFQKYILADPPASFLYFPYIYEVTRG